MKNWHRPVRRAHGRADAVDLKRLVVRTGREHLGVFLVVLAQVDVDELAPYRGRGGRSIGAVWTVGPAVIPCVITMPKSPYGRRRVAGFPFRDFASEVSEAAGCAGLNLGVTLPSSSRMRRESSPD